MIAMACFALLLVALSAAFTLVSAVHCRGAECHAKGRAGSKCLVTGWGILAVGLAVSFAKGFANGFRGSGSPSGVLTGAFTCGALIWVALLFAGMILGAVATQQIKRAAAPPSPRARAQARWTLAAGLSGCLGLALSVVGAALHRDNPVWATSVTPRETLEFPDLNFRFEAPPEPWVQMNATRVNPAASIAFRLHDPDAMFIVIAEKHGIQLGITTDALAEIAGANLRGVYPMAETRQEPRTVAGLDGLLLMSGLSGNRSELFVANWVVSYNGFAYQLTLQGQSRDRVELGPALDGLLSSFELLDPSRVAHGEGFEPAGDYDSTRYGYSADFANTAWSRHPDGEESYADLTLLHGEATFQAIPVSLDSEAPSIECVAVCLASLLGIDYRHASLSNWHEITERGLPGIEFEHEDLAFGLTSRDIVRVLRGREFAYLFAASDAGTGSDEALRDAISRVSLHASEPAALRAAGLTDRERSLHEDIWYLFGAYYDEAGEPGVAARYFRKAFELEGDDPQLLIRLAHAYLDSGQTRLARDYLQAMSSRFAEDPDVVAHLPLAHASAGAIEASVQAWVRLFALGSSEGAHVEEYHALLAEHLDSTQRVLFELRKEEDSETLCLLEASVLAAAGDHRTALAVLWAWHRDRPFSQRVAQQLVDHCYESGEYDLALELCEQLVRHGFDTARTLYQRGRIEFVQKRLTEALATLEMAASKAPADAGISALLAAVRAELKKR